MTAGEDPAPEAAEEVEVEVEEEGDDDVDAAGDVEDPAGDTAAAAAAEGEGEEDTGRPSAPDDAPEDAPALADALADAGEALLAAASGDVNAVGIGPPGAICRDLRYFARGLALEIPLPPRAGCSCAGFFERRTSVCRRA